MAKAQRGPDAFGRPPCPDLLLCKYFRRRHPSFITLTRRAKLKKTLRININREAQIGGQAELRDPRAQG